MKTITLLLVLSTSVCFGQMKMKQALRPHKEINLAGDQLIKFQKKSNTALLCIVGGSGLALLGIASGDELTIKAAGSMGGIIALTGIAINISAIQNVGKAGKHLKRSYENK